jgi:hypothetical protein
MEGGKGRLMKWKDKIRERRKIRKETRWTGRKDPPPPFGWGGP